MKDLYVNVTGFNHYYGKQPFAIGKHLRCTKEPDNPYDDDAIKVTMKEIGTVGYLANSPYTKAEGTLSAGRIYDKVGHKFFIEVMFMTQSKIICKVLPMEEKRPKRKSHLRYEEDFPCHGLDEDVPF